jgi:hypothetical protein
LLEVITFRFNLAISTIGMLILQLTLKTQSTDLHANSLLDPAAGAGSNTASLANCGKGRPP